MPAKNSQERAEEEFYAEKLPNGWSRKLYDTPLALQDVGYHLTTLKQLQDSIPGKVHHLKLAMHRAFTYGDVTEEQLYEMTKLVHEALGIMGVSDIWAIIQEVTEEVGKKMEEPK